MARVKSCKLKLTCETENDGLSQVEGAQHIGARRVTLPEYGAFIGFATGSKSPSETNLVILNPLVAPAHVLVRPCTAGTVEMMAVASSDSEGAWLDRAKMTPDIWYSVGSGMELRLGQTTILGGVVYYAPTFRVHVEPLNLPGEFSG
ncbi:hypothetical protein BFW01_g10193 [Lasiodiplodia theobromae]|uniref:FHA domain-containing protein n=1 Tax=Lasiodiplodia theobromae TaxID=45133 RepID=A0A8H7IP88_9PEZI|nr:hypothetical protein BFW01_g10193 [Lasiodiplodia theobromae]